MGCCPSDFKKMKYGCCCIPWRFTTYVTGTLSLLFQVAAAIIFLSYEIYTGFAPLAIAVIFHIFLFMGLKRKSTRLLRLFSLYQFAFMILLVCMICWLIYIWIKGDDNPFYTYWNKHNCHSSNYADCKNNARWSARWILAFCILTLLITMYVRYVVEHYRIWLIEKRRHQRSDDHCHPTTVPAAPAHSHMNPQTPQVNVFVQQQPTVYPMQPVPPPQQQIYPTYPQQSHTLPQAPPVYAPVADQSVYPQGSVYPAAQNYGYESK